MWKIVIREKNESIHPTPTSTEIQRLDETTKRNGFCRNVTSIMLCIDKCEI